MPEPVRIRHVIDDVAQSRILVFCNAVGCHYRADVAVSLFLDHGATLDTTVPELKRWCRCSKCGGTEVETRPAPYARGVQGTAGAGDER